MRPFSSGPGVLLHVDCEKGKIVRSSLSLADVFSCRLEGPLSSSIFPWLEAYASRKAHPLPPLFTFASLTPFQQSILELMALIPLGTTKSYGEIAQAAGNPKGARAVGGACNRNPFPLFYPCHRIVQKGNRIGGFAVDLEIKRRLLEFEGRQFSVPSSWGSQENNFYSSIGKNRFIY